MQVEYEMPTVMMKANQILIIRKVKQTCRICRIDLDNALKHHLYEYGDKDKEWYDVLLREAKVKRRFAVF